MKWPLSFSFQFRRRIDKGPFGFQPRTWRMDRGWLKEGGKMNWGFHPEESEGKPKNDRGYNDIDFGGQMRSCKEVL